MSRIIGRLTVSAALLGLLVASSSACITKKVFRKSSAEQEERITGVANSAEENERRLGDMKDETRREVTRLDAKTDEARQTASSALSRAEVAEKLARGKVLWEVTLTNDQVKFGFNDSFIPPSATSALDELASKVKSLNKTVYVEIEGHTDSIGSEDYNARLGLKRAEAVRAYLNERGGLPLHLISVISYGESRPLVDNRTKSGRAQNRRVVVRVLE